MTAWGGAAVYLNTALAEVQATLERNAPMVAGPYDLTDVRTAQGLVPASPGPLDPQGEVVLDGYLAVPVAWLDLGPQHPDRFYVAAQGAAWTVREAADDPMGRLVIHVPQRLVPESWTQCHQRALAMAAQLNAGQLPVGMGGYLDPHDDAGWSFVDDSGMRWACTVTDRSDVDGSPTVVVVDDGTAERTVTRCDAVGLRWAVVPV